MGAQLYHVVTDRYYDAKNRFTQLFWESALKDKKITSASTIVPAISTHVDWTTFYVTINPISEFFSKFHTKMKRY